MVLERLRLPKLVVEAHCECGVVLDVHGRHRAACARSGRLRSRAVGPERVQGGRCHSSVQRPPLGHECRYSSDRHALDRGVGELVAASTVPKSLWTSQCGHRHEDCVGPRRPESCGPTQTQTAIQDFILDAMHCAMFFVPFHLGDHARAMSWPLSFPRGFVGEAKSGGGCDNEVRHIGAEPALQVRERWERRPTSLAPIAIVPRTPSLARMRRILMVCPGFSLTAGSTPLAQAFPLQITRRLLGLLGADGSLPSWRARLPMYRTLCASRLALKQCTHRALGFRQSVVNPQTEEEGHQEVHLFTSPTMHDVVAV